MYILLYKILHKEMDDKIVLKIFSFFDNLD